jgi:putative MFS transporter
LLAERLEGAPVSRFHYRLLFLLGLGWMFDAMDILMIGYVLAWLRKPDVWNLSADLSLLTVSVGLLGLMVGALASGYVADTTGRKKVFQYTLLIYAVFSLLSAFSPNVYVLMLFRFLAGIGMGGELPVVSSLLSEFVPAKSRGKFVVLLESFWAYGAVAAALVGYYLIPAFGWQSAFVLGAAPAFFVFVIRQGIPESPRFLAAKGRVSEAERIVGEVEAAGGRAGRLTPTASPSPLPPQRKARLSELLSPLFRRRTLMLWIVWFCITFTYYGIFTWLPSALAVQLRSVTKGFEYTLVITLAQIPGYLSAAYLVERLGRKPVLAAYLLASGLGAYFFGLASDTFSIMALGSVMSFFNLGAWGVLYSYTPELYPTRFRGTGSGAASAVGRIGGISAPIVTIALASAFSTVFATFAGLLFVGAIAVVALGEETKGKTLEQISKE